MKFIKNNYYCLIAGLPDLLIDEGKIHFTLREFRNDLETELSKDDYELVLMLFRSFDNQNILNSFHKTNEPHHDFGTIDANQIDDEIKEPSKNLPDYLVKFINSFNEKNPLSGELSWENQLETLYFQHLLETENDFLRDWFSFSLDLKNILTALSCRKYKIPVENHLIGNNYVVESILRSNSRDFGLSSGFDQIESILNAFENNNLIEREKQIDYIRWNWLEDNTFFHYFTIEKVLSFVIKLQITERWLNLDKAIGKEIFVKLLGDLGKSYELPEEFSLRKKF